MEQFKLGVRHTLPSWYLVSTEDRAIAPDLEHFPAQHIGAMTPEGSDDLEVDGVIYRRELRSRSETMIEDWRLFFVKMKKLATQYGPDGV